MAGDAIITSQERGYRGLRAKGEGGTRIGKLSESSRQLTTVIHSAQMPVPGTPQGASTGPVFAPGHPSESTHSALGKGRRVLADRPGKTPIEALALRTPRSGPYEARWTLTTQLARWPASSTIEAGHG
jgi:hypothetical protein